MKKTIRCRDIGYNCDGIFHAYNEEEALHKAVAHARMVHNLKWLTIDVADRLRSVMRTEEVAA